MKALQKPFSQQHTSSDICYTPAQSATPRVLQQPCLGYGQRLMRLHSLLCQMPLLRPWLPHHLEMLSGFHTPAGVLKMTRRPDYLRFGVWSNNKEIGVSGSFTVVSDNISAGSRRATLHSCRQGPAAAAPSAAPRLSRAASVPSFLPTIVSSLFRSGW
ncbi:hypothetical protein VTI74DRAFT_10707 [Chaetomium olivicolor]